MEAITIESLGTVAGTTLVVIAILQGVKVAFASLTSQRIRRIALILGIALMSIATWASGAQGDARTLTILYVVAGVNGIIAGLAAGAAYDTFAYGDSRVVTNR